MIILKIYVHHWFANADIEMISSEMVAVHYKTGKTVLHFIYAGLFIYEHRDKGIQHESEL